MKEDQGRIDELKARLYSRSKGNERIYRRRTLRERQYDVKRGWSPDARPVERKSRPQKKRTFLSLFLIFSAVFFILSAGFSAFYFFGGSNIVSADNVDIEIQGPTSIAGGEELQLQISIANKNNVELQLADLIIEYPDGTRAAGNLSKDLPRYRESIGTIKPGERIKKTVSAVLFGEENTPKDVKVTVEYRIPTSNAIFYTEKSYPLTLSSSPMGVAVRGVEEISSGQDISFTVTVVSNATAVIKDALLVAEYPFGFSFTSSTPSPDARSSVWQLGDLEPGEEQTIRIVGKMTGQDNEERVFRFSGGSADQNDDTRLATAFVTVVKPVLIARPFITTEVALNGETTSEYIANTGERIRADISWLNNLATRVEDAKISVRITGSVLDKNTVSVDRGQYLSGQNLITWNGSTDASLATLEAGESGRVSFTFSPLTLAQLGNLKNQTINLEVSVSGRRVSEDGVTETIESNVTRTVKLNSNLLLSSRALHFSSPLSNNGPMPPQVDKETTYTVVWTVTNSSNQVSGAKVVATLPSYMRWVGIVSPTSESVSYNPVGGTVTWELGEVASGVGSATSPREVLFQVGLVPSASQIGDAPALIGTQTLVGFDRFTETEIRATERELTTNINESGFNATDALVVP